MNFVKALQSNFKVPQWACFNCEKKLNEIGAPLIQN